MKSIFALERYEIQTNIENIKCIITQFSRNCNVTN